jgi:hypothetical protein
MERVLKKETSLHAVDCGGRRLQENETDANNNVTVCYLLAVDIKSASQSTESEFDDIASLVYYMPKRN